MIKLRDHSDFAALVTALANDVVDAHIHFKLHEAVANALDAKPDVAIQSRNFWNLTLQAHLTTAINALARAYDQQRSSLHLRSWLLTIQDNMELFTNASFRHRLRGNPFVESLAVDIASPDPVRLQNDIDQCTATDPVVQRLVIFRNNYSAHRPTAPLLRRPPGDENALTYDDVRMLLTRSHGILNTYSLLFSATAYSINLVGGTDFQYIIDCVDRAVQASKSEWAAPASDRA